jgi:hypothetical protein
MPETVRARIVGNPDVERQNCGRRFMIASTTAVAKAQENYGPIMVQ